MHNRHVFSVFYKMKICCVFSLESPYQENSNEYTHYTIFNINKYKAMFVQGILERV